MAAETFHHRRTTSIPPRKRLRVVYRHGGEHWGFSWEVGQERLIIDRIDELMRDAESGLRPTDGVVICRHITRESRAALDADIPPPDDAA